MKFQHSKIHFRALVFSATFMVLSVIVLIYGEKQVPTRFFAQQVAAAQKMKICIDSLKTIAEMQSIEISPQLDPNRTFLIGEEYTPITTTIGNLKAKRTATNPDFAALLVRWFNELELKSGDAVAIGCSGSFPGLILAAICASEAMNLKPIIISSLGASGFGANRLNFTWLDIENYLFQKGLIQYRSIAASPGGVGDVALDLSATGKKLLHDAIQRNQVHLIEIEDTEQNIKARKLLYGGEEQPKIFINIGGAQINIGDYHSEKKLSPGLNLPTGKISSCVKSMAAYFLNQRIPIIHFLAIEQIARENGLAIDPLPFPEAGQSRVYFDVSLPLPVKMSVFFLILLAMLSIGFSRRKNSVN